MFAFVQTQSLINYTCRRRANQASCQGDALTSFLHTLAGLRAGHFRSGARF